MNSIRIVLAFSLISSLTLITTCKDEPKGAPHPKFHTAENAGIWTDKVDTHVPVITKLGGGKIEVRVTFSPTMNPLHYVESIVLMKGENQVIEQRKFQPSVSIPTVEFELPNSDDDYWIIEKCNLHGMWKANIK